MIFSLNAILFISIGGFVYKSSDKYRKEIPITSETEINVNLDAGFGHIMIMRGSSNQILNTDIMATLKNDLAEYIDYSNRDNIGYLNINTTEAIIKESTHRKGHSLHLSGLEDNAWNMRFTDSIPISFEIELGMGKGDFDFSGLMVKDLNLSTGASSVVIRFDTPNKSEIENLTIETGLSKFKGYSLCNSNFNHMKFQGGVGSYVLDFSGKLNKEVEVDIEVGLGSLNISIPDNIGTKIYYEKSWVSTIDIPKDFKEEEEHYYFSPNYYDVNGKINMHIEAGLGSVKIKRE